MIWFKNYQVSDWNSDRIKTIHDSLGIEITEVGNDYLVGRMPIDERTFQPMQILHGGASVVLAESLGSIAAVMCVDTSKYYAVGQTLSASHIRPGIKGWATGKATPVHIGSRSQIWKIDITNDADKLLCTVQITMAVVPHKKIDDVR
jgi:1,4-dihydroxy-2-naphthoyl-CoA hydrolase